MAMTKFRFICPDCNAVVITASPSVLVWELCPACKRHVWDQYDALMADACVQDPQKAGGCSVHADN